MNEIALLEDEVCDDNPLKIEIEPDIAISSGFESMVTIFHGLVTTPPKRLKDPSVRAVLKERLHEVALVTHHSCEDLVVSLEGLGTYSTENAFLDGVRTVINKILEWLGRVRDWFITLFKKVFDIRTQQKTTSRQTEQTFNQAKQKYASDTSSNPTKPQAQKKPLPQTIEVTVPGTALIIFHWQKFDPAQKTAYTSDAIRLSLDKIDKQFTTFMKRFQSTTNQTLAFVEDILRDLEAPHHQVSVGKDWDATRTGFMRDLYQNHWECIGVGVVEKPVRSRSNKAPMHKYGLTNLTDQKGWSGIGQVNIRIRINDFEKLNSEVQSVTDHRLADLILLNDALGKSKVLKRLSTLKRTLKEKLDQLQSQGDEVSSTISAYNADLERVEMIHEFVSQIADNAYLMSRFYTRYATTLTNLLSVAAKKLDSEAS